MIKRIKYGDSIIQYSLIKSKRRKTSQITVTPDGVTIRTPQTKTIVEVERIMQQRVQWIFKKQLDFAKQKNPSLSTKSILLVRGKNYKIQIIPKSAEKTRLVGNTIEFHIPQKRYKIKQIKTQYQTYLQKRADVLFPKMVKKLAREVGVHPTKTNVKQLKERWGSSTITGEINLNCNLMKASEDVIRYAIFHELCHLKVKEHSHHFWNLVAKHMPKYKESKKWLECNGVRIS